MPTDERRFLHKLAVEVEAELAMAESSNSEEELRESPAEWLFDPTDVEREDVGLRGILGAVEAVENDGPSSDVAPPSVSHRPGLSGPA